MRKDSPLLACIAAALVLVVAGILALPHVAWSAGPTALRFAPAIFRTTVEQAQVAASAARTGAFSARVLLQDRALEPSRPERPVRVCQGEGFHPSCPQTECARIRIFRRLPVLMPTSG